MKFTVLETDPFEESSIELYGRSNHLPLLGLVQYLATLAVGSRKERVQVLVDTASSDLWVMGRTSGCERQPGKDRQTPALENASAPALYFNALNTSAVKPPRSLCRISGTFNQNLSTTYRLNKSDSDLCFYTMGTLTCGIWGTDTVIFGGLELRTRFGVAIRTLQQLGVIGLGPVHGEQTFRRHRGAYIYDNFPVALLTAGKIKRVVYSITLEPGCQEGAINFGTVDHRKYLGHLQTVPIVNVYRNIHRLDLPSIRLDAISLKGSGQHVAILNEPIGAKLDSKLSFLRFPANVMRPLAHALLAKRSRSGFYELDCAYLSSPANLVYDFSGIEIKVPLKRLLFKANATCYLGAKESDPAALFPLASLGTNFLSNAYIVYDLERMEISMAPAHHTNDSEEEEVTTAIPRAVRAPQYSSTSLVTQISEQTPVKFEAPHPIQEPLGSNCSGHATSTENCL